MLLVTINYLFIYVFITLGGFLVAGLPFFFFQLLSVQTSPKVTCVCCMSTFGVKLTFQSVQGPNLSFYLCKVILSF